MGLGATQQVISYHWYKGNRWHWVQAISGLELNETPQGSEAEFITEHYWGYAKVNDTKTAEYEVLHPRWQCYPVKGFEIDVDFSKTYGDRFSFLTATQPVSVFLAEGSAIEVKSKRVF